MASESALAREDIQAAAPPTCAPEPTAYVMPTTGLTFTLPPDPDLDGACVQLPIRPSAPSLFRMVAMPIGANATVSKWETARLGAVSDRPGPWDELLSEVRRLPDLDPFTAINQWVNWNVRYREDAAGDEWSSAAATLARGYGDCEDLALAKMGLLLAAGLPSDDMYLVLLRDRAQSDHAVLAVKRDGQLFVLDNRTDKVLPAAAIADYTPVLSFSGPFAWTYGYRATTR